MTEDAIQEDVSEDIESIDSEIKDDRADFIEQLAERHAEGVSQEIKEADNIQDIDDEEIEDVDDDVEEEIDDEPKEQLVRVKVDGEEMELPLSEVVKVYQKESTADRRLEQAAKERQELERIKAEIEAKATEVSQPSNEDVDDDIAERLANALDDLTVGDEQEKKQAANVIKELLGGRRDNPAIQEDQIVSKAAQQALLQMQYTSAQQRFVEDYQDIVEDETLYQMAMNVFNNAVPQSQTYEQAFHTAGNAVRQWRDGLMAKHQVTDKQSLKERLHREPNKVGSKANLPPKAKPETPSDIIAAMKASRGQPT